MPIKLPEIPPDGNYQGTALEISADFEEGRIVITTETDGGYHRDKIYNLKNPKSLAVCVDDFGRLGYRSPTTLEEAVEDFQEKCPQRITYYIKDGAVNSIKGRLPSFNSEHLNRPKVNPDLLEYAVEKAKFKMPQKLDGRIVRPIESKDLIFIECEENGDIKTNYKGLTWGVKGSKDGIFSTEFDLTFWEAWGKRDWRFRYMSNKGWAEWEKPQK